MARYVEYSQVGYATITFQRTKIQAKGHRNMPQKVPAVLATDLTLNGWLLSTQVSMGSQIQQMLVASRIFSAEISSFHTSDEYLIPMGNYNSMIEVVDDATKDGTQILTFRSTRASPIYSFME